MREKQTERAYKAKRDGDSRLFRQDEREEEASRRGKERNNAMLRSPKPRLCPEDEELSEDNGRGTLRRCATCTINIVPINICTS